MQFELISDKMPSIPVPTLKSINSIPKLKDRSCDFLGRITCNLFQSHLPQRNVPQSGNVLERRTVDSRHISTISSLVDKNGQNAVHEGGSHLHESQKENFGLYALKYSRSNASKCGSLQSQKGGSRSTVENQSHEHFQPCRASSIESSSSQQSVAHDEEGYCEIELSDESATEEVRTNRVKSAKNAEKVIENAIESNRLRAVPPVPPKRVKNKIRQRQPQTQQQKLYIPPEAPCGDGELVERSLHSQRIKLSSEKRFSPKKLMNQTDMQSAKYDHDSVRPKNDRIEKMSNQFEQINVRKNKSELYRIAGSKSSSTVKATIEEHQPSPSVRQNGSKRRNLHRHSLSSVKSVDIFKSTNELHAFDDFDDVLEVVPVVAVDRYSVPNECIDENRNRNRPKRSNRVKIRNMEMNRRSGADDRSTVSRDNNANNQTWNISTDSNELTIYSHEKLTGDLDEEIIV